ncbi:M15 family metallopeptidase [Actinoplanes sp. NPDC051861]|uniref:M15 family metallopeptidase n=1 Tax=Actinoplanes sp. NPDC051861 TaxID=3155170 RepID=UPI00343D38CA
MATLLGFTVPAKASAVATYLVPGTTVKLTLARDVAPLLLAVARDFDREVEELIKGQCGGFNPRKIAGTEKWSRHAIAAAIDLNWLKHPMGRRNTFSPAKQDKIRAILRRYTHKGVQVIRWGGAYSTPDDMHFEVNVPRAAAVAAVKALQKPRKPAPAGGPKPGDRTLRQGASGPDVAYLQRWVGAEDDGKFGQQTRLRVIRYQKIVGVPATGVADSKTWAKILGR